MGHPSNVPRSGVTATSSLLAMSNLVERQQTHPLPFYASSHRVAIFFASMIFLFFTDQTQRDLTRQRQKLLLTMDNQLFTTPEPWRR